MKDAIIKRIEGYHHLRTILWTILTILGGGTTNKISNIHSFMDVLLAVGGIILIIMVLRELKNKTMCLRKHYKHLEDF